MFRRVLFFLSISLLFNITGSLLAQERWSIDPRMTGLKAQDKAVLQPSQLPTPYVHQGHDPRVYNTPIGVMVVNPNVRVHPSSNTQSEVIITRHPGNQNIMFGSSNAVDAGVTFISEGVYMTTDGGTSWFGSDTLSGSPIGDHGGDPGPTIDKNGTLIESHLGSGGMYANYSTNNGATWSATYTITSSSADKNLSGTDDAPSSAFYGRSYTVWSDFSASAPPIVISYTTNGGVSWSAKATINTPPASHYSQGCDIRVGPNGEVYVVWTAPIAGSPYTGDFLGFAKSTNGGVTWTVTENAYDMNGIRGTLAAKASIRVNDFPRLDVDRSGGSRNGWIYVVTGEKSLAPAGSDPDIVLHRSTDGGTTWSAGIRVNQDALNNGKTQYMPAIRVDENGGINVVYYDDRNTSTDSAEVYVSRSIDGGTTWTDVLVSDHRFKPKPISGLAGGYQGDYIGITSGNAKVWPLWMDDKSGLYQAWTTSISIADPIDPNPPTGVTAYSQFSTPTSIQLNWTNPTTLVNGSPIGSFVMRIKRDGVQITEITPPTAAYSDGGRTTYQQYTYTLETRLTANDSLSAPVQVSWIAGGSPYPSAPSGVGILITAPTLSTQATISWTNPTTQEDGTPIHNFGGTRIWRNGALRDSVGSGITQYIDTPPPGFVYTYYLEAYNTLTPRRYSDPSASVGGYVGSLPDILVWQPADALSNSADSLIATLTRLGKSCFKTDSLFEFGSDLSSFDAIFAIMGTYTDNHVILAADPEGPALNTYVNNGGKLYLEGGDVFNYDPETGGYQVRPIFGLNDGSDGGSDVAGGFNGLGLLSGMTFTYSEAGSFMDELHPNSDNAARTMLIAPTSSPVNDTMSVYAFYGTGRSVAMVPEFGNMGNTLEAGNRDSLISKILQFFNASQSPPEINITPLALADTLPSNQTSSLSFTISNTTTPPADGLIVGISESVGWLSVSPAADTIGGAANSVITVNFDATGLTPATYNTNIVVTSNDSNEPSTNVAVTLVVTGSSNIVTRPDSIVKVMAQNTTSTDTLVIKNTGLAPLTWSIVEAFSAPNTPYVPQPQGDEVFPPRRGRDGWAIPWEKDEKDPSRGSDVLLGSGGPDSAGYRWIDSDEPGGPTFNWLDIVGLGTEILEADWLGSADDGRKNVGLPFTFTYYGVGYDSLKIVTNGHVGFDRTSTNVAYSNVAIPVAGEPNNAIYGFWDDLDLRATAGTGRVHYYNDVANSRFIVQYTNAPHFTGTVGTYTFQVILYADGRILYQYQTMVGVVNSSTIGIESPGGTVALQVAFNAAYIHDGLAVLIAKDVPWVSTDITSGTVNPGDSTKVAVTFDNTGFPDGEYTAHLQIDNNDGAHNPKNVPLHMTVGASSVGVSVLAGWNLVSNPVTTPSDSVRQLFPPSTFEYAFDYTPGSGYSQQYIMDNGVGYWEKFPANASFSIPGTFRTLDSVDVVDGWNIVGSISTPVDTSNTSTVPGGLRVSPFYGFNNGYVPATSLTPGQGYWMKANGSGKVILSSTLKPAGIAAPASRVSAFDDYSALTVRDSRGGSQTLYIGKSTSEVYEMPPAGPSGTFDARFDSQRMVEAISADQQQRVDYPITIQSAAYPVTISWNVKGDHRLSLRDGITGSIMSARSISGAGQTTITSPSITRLVVSVQPTGVPTSFGLSQNFPNPFNPTTQIGYALPEAATVTLKVFDLLGQEVSSLAIGVQNAGYHSIDWNGRSNSGTQLASGIYFYRLEAFTASGQTFRDTRKMTLMK